MVIQVVPSFLGLSRFGGTLQLLSATEYYRLLLVLFLPSLMEEFESLNDYSGDY